MKTASNPNAAVSCFDTLKDRSRIDEETGCWHVTGHRHKGTTTLWCAPAQAPISLTAAIAWLMTGKPARKGTLWVAMCGHTDCGNPAHRKLGDRGLLMRVMRPKLSPLHRARIAKAHRDNGGVYSPELKAEIIRSPENGAALARRLGIDPSTVQRVRNGQRWHDVAPGSSVFSFAAAA